MEMQHEEQAQAATTELEVMRVKYEMGQDRAKTGPRGWDKSPTRSILYL